MLLVCKWKLDNIVESEEDLHGLPLWFIYIWNTALQQNIILYNSIAAKVST